MRKLVTALSLLGMGAYTQVLYGLGLGDIEVLSALNQPLEAEIALTSVRAGEVDGLIVKLASEQAFIQAGVERPFYLTKLKFNVATKPDGTNYIKVTTGNPFREPFVNFLIDVDWPRGRLVREYTVLLDPPVFSTQQQSAPPAPSIPDVAPVPDADISSDIPDIELDSSAAGEPALIERDLAEEPTAEGEFDYSEEDFSEDQSAIDVVDPSSTTGVDEALPEIELDAVDDAESIDSEFSEAEASDELGFDDSISEPIDDTPIPEIEAEDLPNIAVDTESETDSAIPDLVETTEPDGSLDAVDDRLADQELPDINISLDDNLSYDEDATNAILSQFDSEDRVTQIEQDENLPDISVDSTSDSQQPAYGDEYTIEQGDTLWDIASQYKSPDVTVHQAMLSILRYNPDAFIKNNINDVKKGFVLRIPDKQEMLEINSAEALQEVKNQNALWKEYKSQFAGSVSGTDDFSGDDNFSTDSEEDTSGQLSILAPGRDAESAERASGEQEGVESGESLAVDLQLAREQLEAERLEKADLEERLSELNNQLETMDRLISLKNDQLAELQGQLSEEEVIDAESSTQNIDEFDDLTAAETEEESDLGLTLDGEGTEEELDILEEDPLAATDESTDLELDGELLGDIDGDATTQDESLNFEDGLSVDEGDLGFEDELADTEESLTEEDPLGGSDLDLAADEDGLIEDEPLADEAQEELTEEPSSGLVAADPSSKPSGLLGILYDIIPPPYNKLATDLLQKPFGMGVLAVILLVLVGVPLLLLARKSKAKKVQPVIGATGSEPASTATQGPSFFERIKSLFAKKNKVAPDFSEPADATEAAEAITETGGEELAADETITTGFEETAKAAADAAGFEQPAISGEDADPQATGEFLPETQKFSEPEPDINDDTTAEADVYLAYGLFDQAEELLTQALDANPDKLPYKGKLLETYFSAGKKEEFEKLADQINIDLAGKPSRIWDKAIAMGKEIAPDNSLFSDAKDTGLKASDFVPAKPESADLDLSDSDVATAPDIEFGDTDEASSETDFDLDLGETQETESSEFESTVIDTGQEQTGSDDSDLEFDLAESDDVSSDQDTELDDSDLEVDFNEDDLGFGEDMDMNEPEPTVAMSVNVNFDLDDEPSVDEDSQDEEAAASETTDMEDFMNEELSDTSSGNTDLDIDVSGLEMDDGITDLDAGTAENDSGALAALELDGELDQEADSGLDLSDTQFDEPINDDTIIDSDLEDDIFTDEADADEVSTKLDLAKAYMDMGDYDGANSTLAEVVAEGNDSQRKEAEELLQQIG